MTPGGRTEPHTHLSDDDDDGGLQPLAEDGAVRMFGKARAQIRVIPGPSFVPAFTFKYVHMASSSVGYYYLDITPSGLPVIKNTSTLFLHCHLTAELRDTPLKVVPVLCIKMVFRSTSTSTHMLD